MATTVADLIEQLIALPPERRDHLVRLEIYPHSSGDTSDLAINCENEGVILGQSENHCEGFPEMEVDE